MQLISAHEQLKLGRARIEKLERIVSTVREYRELIGDALAALEEK